MLSLVTGIFGMLWEDSQVASEIDAPTDSDSLPESAGDVTQWAEGVPGDPARVPCCALRWLREGQTLWKVRRPGPRGSALDLPGPPTSFLFEMKTSPAHSPRSDSLCSHFLAA